MEDCLTLKCDLTTGTSCEKCIALQDAVVVRRCKPLLPEWSDTKGE